ncbi:hypothetical protein N8198_08560 [Gammaproteobacteria bacterium]|nr:hypothetical protein [Gammaproteobacteria bacterium]
MQGAPIRRAGQARVWSSCRAGIRWDTRASDLPAKKKRRPDRGYGAQPASIPVTGTPAAGFRIDGVAFIQIGASVGSTFNYRD